VLRRANGDERAWRAEVDGDTLLENLLPDLLQALPIDGEATDYELKQEGSLNTPILVLTVKPQKRVQVFEELG